MIIFINELQLRNPELYWFGLFNFFIAASFVLLMPFIQIKVLGIHAFIKPIKFALSIAIYSWTMAWYMFYLKDTN
jgi:uncharacterized membrane protein YvlD (DUF360 family)